MENGITSKVAVSSKRKRGRPSQSEQGESTRRVSSRIATKQKEEKEKLVQKRVKLLEEDSKSKKNKATSRERVENMGNTENCCNEPALEMKPEAPNTSFDGGDGQMVNCSVDGGNLVVERSAHHKVKETLRTFNKHYLQLVQVVILFPSLALVENLVSFKSLI